MVKRGNDEWKPRQRGSVSANLHVKARMEKVTTYAPAKHDLKNVLAATALAAYL